jgi:hypothetical protein
MSVDCFHKLSFLHCMVPTPVVERSKAMVYGSSLTGIASSNSSGGMDVCVVCCKVEFSATGRLLIQGSPADCSA